MPMNHDNGHHFTTSAIQMLVITNSCPVRLKVHSTGGKSNLVLKPSQHCKWRLHLQFPATQTQITTRNYANYNTF